MPKISIIRPANEWTNQQRKTYIYIDREKVGHVESGQTAQFEVLPGKHKVVLKQRWAGGSKPLEVDLSDNKDATIKMRSFKYNWLLLIIIFPFITSIYQTLFNFEGFLAKFMGNLLVVGLIYLVFYMLFLRTGFIKLERVSTQTDI